jgi:acyl transferase domain-containing protein
MNHLYKSAGLDPLETSFVEAHGTGTSAGDPIEAASLSKIFSNGRLSAQPLIIGSVKSNIGHLEGGSGIAGVIKTILMLEKGLILPNFDFETANSKIAMQKWKLQVQRAIRNSIEPIANYTGTDLCSALAYSVITAGVGQQLRIWRQQRTCYHR